MKKQILTMGITACMAWAAQGEILIGGAATKTFDTVQGGNTDNNLTLTDNGSAGSLASGETWTVHFKITVNSTSDTLAPAWQDSAEAIKIGFVDKNSSPAQGGGFELDLFGTPRLRVGGDASAGGASTFNLLSTTGSALTSGDVTGTSGALQQVGDVGYFTFSVTNNEGSRDIGVVWSDGAGNETTASYNTTALPVYDSVERMCIRVPDFEGTTQTANLTVEMLEPPTTDPVDPPYDSWLALYPGLGGGTNLTDDAENGGVGDGMDNLLEFALGADPTVDDAAAFLPVSALDETGGTNYLNYVYRRSTDTNTLNVISYSVVAGTDLVSGNITNATEEAGTSGDLGDGFESVTNRVPVDAESKQFMQLKVQEN